MSPFYNLKHLLGLTLSGKIRFWINDLKKEKYYRADTKNVFSYLVHYSNGDTYTVEFRIYCNHPIKKRITMSDGRTTIHSKSFMTLQEAQIYQEKEIKSAASFYNDTKFFREREGHWEYFQKMSWHISDGSPYDTICPECGGTINYVTKICPYCGGFVI